MNEKALYYLKYGIGFLVLSLIAAMFLCLHRLFEKFYRTYSMSRTVPVAMTESSTAPRHPPMSSHQIVIRVECVTEGTDRKRCETGLQPNNGVFLQVPPTLDASKGTWVCSDDLASA